MIGTIGNRFNWRFDSQAVPASPIGTLVTPGASNGEGDWVEIVTGANLAQDAYMIWLFVGSGFTSGAQRTYLLDIGTDPAGGSSWVERIANLTVGLAGNKMGRQFLFPYLVKAGSSIAVRILGAPASPTDVRVAMSVFGRPSRPEAIRAAQYAESFTGGSITNGGGGTVTPGTSAGEGSWTSVGTTVRPLWWWQASMQEFDTSMQTGQYIFLDVGYSTDGGSTVTPIIENHMTVVSSSAEELESTLNVLDAFCEVPAGAGIYVRMSTNLGSADANLSATVVGLGG